MSQLYLTLPVREAIEQAIKDGWVQKSKHPNLPLYIYNYTKNTQFARHWTPITKMCRGLVVAEDGEIIIRSPEKFFNQWEPDAPNLDIKDCHIYDKLDGYYISIRYDSEYGLIVTSRGSFNSKYAEKAREILKNEKIQFNLDTDYFCELLCNFPEDSGVIVTKHPKERLVLWSVNRGEPFVGDGWTGERVKQIEPKEMQHYLSKKVEGVVLYDHIHKRRVKVKTEWYLALHRAISGCTKNKVWEILQGGGKIAGQKETTYIGLDKQTHSLDISQIPEEHLEVIEGWEKELQEQYDYYVGTAHFYEDMYKDYSDKSFATNPLVPQTYRNIVLAWRHKKDPTKQIWRSVKNKLLRNTEN